MSDINIFFIVAPKRGKRIAEGMYGYTKTQDGLPTMQCAWKGTFFSSEPLNFIFPRHASKFTLVNDDDSEKFARWKPHKGRRNAPWIIGGIVPGIIGGIARLTSDAIRLNKDFSGMKGFAFTYANPEGDIGLCWAIAPASCVDEIVASIPPERIDPAITPFINKARQ